MKIAVVTKKNMSQNPARLLILSELKKDVNLKLVEVENLDEIDFSFDKILVFGGDGTMLTTVKKASELKIAILGVNLGNLGFLTQFESSVSPRDVSDALFNGFYIEKMLLDVGAKGHTLQSLNEAVVKSTSSHPIFLDLYVDGQFVDSYHADGMIVSTPTGSTAYSLSAGGAVLAPDLEGVIINPICPHSLHSRPLVVSAKSKIELVFSNKNETIKAVCAVDGKEKICLEKGDVLKIEKSTSFVKFVDVSNNDFYSRLLNKMNRWGTTT